MTKGGCSGCARTWLATGKDLDSDNGWHENADWRVPDKVIGQKDGDPGFRLVDIKGNGYPDIIWIRQKDDGTYDKGVLINNGASWIDSTAPIFVPDLPFADKNGIDQGVRLLSVTGKGLTDIVASFQGRTQTVEVNKARRADVLDSVTDGYGLKTSVFYQTLLEVDGADKDSGVVTNPPPGLPTDRPLGWRTYERGSPDSYPKVAPVPTTYVVRKAAVDEGDGRTVVFDYRYGRYRVDGEATRSLGFGWRESLNEASNILTRSDMVQDARARPGVSRESTCIVKQDVLRDRVKKDLTSDSDDPNDRFPADLRQEGPKTAFDWGYKISENKTCWTVYEGDVNGTVNDVHLPDAGACGNEVKRGNLTSPVIRQSFISMLRKFDFEVDGQTVLSGTDSFAYDTTGGILDRHGNVVSTASALDDGTSIETTNEYADDPSRWFLGRLTKTKVVKRGDLIGAGPTRMTETRCSGFEYEKTTGLLSAQETNCETSKVVTTRMERDTRGNVIVKSISAFGEPTGTSKSQFDAFGRYEVATLDVLGHRSSAVRDVTTGQPLSLIDPNELVTTFEYDSFGRPRKQISPTGIATTTQGFAAAAATETTSAFGLDTKISDLHVLRAALVGGTVAAISGGKFVNGAVFSSLQEVIAGGYSENQSPGRRLTEEEKLVYRYSFNDQGEILDDSVLDSARVHEGEVPFWLGSDARAVTIGNDIYIRPGEYDPDSVDGAELLGHELTHVQQFRNGMGIIDYVWAARNGLENNKYENEAYGNEPAFGQTWVWQRAPTGRIFCSSPSCR
jgi:YD repeat-containing protein